MSDVFISYASEDRELAHRLADALEAQGLNAWWDREILIGANFAGEILLQLTRARAVCVLWSQASLRSEFVYDEAMRAHREGKLLPVRIEDVEPPLGFGALQRFDLIGWDGDAGDLAIQQLIQQLRTRIARPPGTAVHRPRRLMNWVGDSPRRRWLAGAGVLAAGSLAGGFAWWRFERYMADDYVLAGLAANRSNDLQAARRQFLLAIEYDRRNAVAHYELANVYLRLYLDGGSSDARLQSDALTHFVAAVRHARGLDSQQLGDATSFAAALAAPDVAQPVTRVAQATIPIERLPPTGAGTAVPDAAPTPGTGAPGSALPPQAAPAPGADPPAVADAGTGGEDTSPIRSPARPPAAAAPSSSVAAERMPASADVARSAALQGAALFDPDRDRRVAAFNVLALNPALRADTVRPALERALASLRSAPESPATLDGVGQTLALLQSASPGTLRVNRADVARLIDAAHRLGGRNADAAARLQAQLERAATQRPLVYLQIAGDAQRGLAEQINRRMHDAGYLTPTLEVVGAERAPARTALRIQGGSDAGYARWCAAMLEDLIGGPVDVQTLRNAHPSTDTYEIWLGRTLCSGDAVRGCA